MKSEKNKKIQEGNTKNGQTRFLRINDDVREALSTLKRHPKTKYVFYGKDGLPYDFRKSFETALKKSGIFGFHFHDLRHSLSERISLSYRTKSFALY